MSYMEQEIRAVFDYAKMKHISVVASNGRVCGPLMFHTGDIIHFLDCVCESKKDGLEALRELSKLVCMKGADIIDYEGSAVGKWCMDNEDKFDEKVRERVCSFIDAPVYVNNFAKSKREHDDINQYCLKNYPQEDIEAGLIHGDGLLWFWVGEY